MKVIHLDTVSSTNQFLKDNYEKLDDLTLVSAEHQTNGRGRLGRTWEAGDDLLFSILLKNVDKDYGLYSLFISTVILKALQKYELNPMIKWPNDIIINDKKTSGILLEAVTNEDVECIVIGIGINVNTTNFSPDLKDKATSLALELKKRVDKKELLNRIIKIFNKDYKLYQKDKTLFLDIVRKHNYLKDKEVDFIFNSKNEKGIVQGITDKGFIVIQTTDGRLEISSGEISFHHLY